MEYRRVNNDFEEVAAQVEALRKTTRWFAWRQLVTVVGLPFGARTDSTGGVSRRIFASNQPMSDAWLQAVAELPEISESGLKRLAGPLKTKGFVSLKDAVDFIKIERARIDANVNLAAAVQSRRQIGATMLLERAERELPGYFQRFSQTTRDVASAATGYASFTIEKAIWIGKGLGFIGDCMQKVRTTRSL